MHKHSPDSSTRQLLAAEFTAEGYLEVNPHSSGLLSGTIMVFTSTAHTWHNRLRVRYIIAPPLETHRPYIKPNEQPITFTFSLIKDLQLAEVN